MRSQEGEWGKGELQVLEGSTVPSLCPVFAGGIRGWDAKTGLNNFRLLG